MHDDQPSSLYESKRALNRSSNRIEAADSALQLGNKTSLLGQSSKTIRRKYAAEDKEWKARRRASEQTRMNDMTGLLEQVDMLEVRKNEYLALK